MAKTKEQDDPFLDDDFGDGMPDSDLASEEMPDADPEDRPQFLKPHHLGRNTSGSFELVRVTSETSDYSDVILLIKVRKKLFRLGLKFFSPDYKALLARFGKKRSDWHGELRFKVMPHRGNAKGYVAVR